MLQLRSDQLEAIRKGRLREFALEVLTRAKAERPQLCAGRSDQENLPIIEGACEKAKSYGLFAPPDVERFARIVLAHGEDYESKPDIAGPLGDPELIGSQKLDRIEAGSA